MTDKTLHLTGRVIHRQTGRGLAGLRVEAWDQDRAQDDPLGHAVTDEQGRFAIDVASDAFSKREAGDNPLDFKPDVYFKVFRGKELIADTTENVRWNADDETGEVVIEVDGPEEEKPPPEKTARVSGRVLKTDGASLPGVVVRAFGKRLREEVRLGEAVADETGQYAIDYEVPDAKTNGRGVNLVLRVFASDDKNAEALAASPVLFGAGPSEALDLVVVSEQAKPASEYEKLQEALAPLLQQVDPATISGDDVAFLSRETGLDAQRITHFALAARVEAAYDLPAAAYYGLARQDLPTRLPVLLAQDAAAKRRALDAAVRKNVIPASVGAEADALLERMNEVAVDRALLTPETAAQPSVGPLLDTTGLPKETQQVFLTRYVQHEGDVASFWQAMREDPDFNQNGTVDTLQFTLRLGALTAGHAPLVKALQQRRQEGQLDRLRELARLTEDDWTELLTEEIDGQFIGAPEGLPGETADEQRQNYAKALTRIVESAYPTAVVAHRLREDETFAHEEVLRFFEEQPTFEFSKNNIERYLDEHPEVREGFADEQDTVQRLRGMQRLFAVTPRFERYEAMQPLVQDGVDSAHRITLMGKPNFLRTYADRMGGAQRALYVYEKSAQRNAMVENTMAKFSPVYDATGLTVLPNIRDLVGEQSGEIEASPGIPDLETLFGRLDYCECKHCRSVYSPAAYLTDLLHLLDTGGGDGAPLDALFAPGRRPDIGKIELTCKNTNTPLPYVDLVNEVLENAVAPDDNEAGYQTTWREEELRAQPEHLNAAAYDALREAVYPWHLPFDLWTEEARTYLEHLGVPRHRLMATFQAEQDPSDAAIAAEYIGLAPKEQQIVTGTAPEDVWQLWGLQEANNAIADPADPDRTLRLGWVDALRRAPVLLEQSGLSFTELLDLLRTTFVNPNQDDAGERIEVRFPDGSASGEVADATCDLTEATLVHLTAQALDRMHRCTRLRRTLGWSAFALDRAFSSLGLADLDDGALVVLADLERLRAAFDVPLVEILSWYASVSTRPDGEEPALYEWLFLDRSVIAPSNPSFALNDDRSEVSGAGEDMMRDDHAATLQAGLRVTAAELETLLTHKEGLGGDATLSLAQLSSLHRRASLARALSLSEQALLDLMALSGRDPFGDPASTRRFAAVLEQLQTNGFSVTELGYLLRHARAADVQLEEEQIRAVLKSIQDGFEQIEQENTLPPAPANAAPSDTQDQLRELLRTKLAALLQMEADAAAPQDPDAAAVVERAVLLVGGTTEASKDDQRAFIDTHFADFLSTPAERDDAKAQLVGPDGQPPALQEPAARYRYVLEPLLERLRQRLKAQFVDRALAQALGLEEAVAAVLLAHTARPGAPGGTARSAFLDAQLAESEKTQAFVRLHKAAMLITTLEIGADELTFLIEHQAEDGWLDVTALPVESGQPASFDAWERLVDLLALREALPGRDPSLPELLSDVFAFDPATGDADAAEQTLLETLAERTGGRVEDLTFLAGAEGFDFAFPEAYREGKNLLRLQEASDVLRRLGVSARQAASWAEPKLPGDSLRQAAHRIKQTVRAKYDHERWLAVAKPLQDALREKRRRALTAYLVAEGFTANGTTVAFRDANALFGYFLLDVEMSACMMTSRIKQAISSVQLFVQRALMSLEPEVTLGPEFARDWTWLKNYRVWEANRKVFLYPENWTEPELRDNKSPFYEALEDELLQNEVTTETAETAFLNYLEKLDEVADLEVAGLYHEVEEGTAEKAPVDVLHVFARTRNTPHIYYYRRRVDDARWTPWERVDLDIQGDHLIPVVYNRRPHLFWPIFTEKAAEQALPGKDEDGKKPQKYWEIQMAWSERKNGKWSAKRVSEVYRESFYSPFSHTSLPPKGRFFFWPWTTEDSDLYITVDRHGADGSVEMYGGSFRFAVCKGHVEDGGFLLQAWEAQRDTQREFMALVGGDQALHLVTRGEYDGFGIDSGTKQSADVLEKTPGRFTLLLPNQFDYYPFTSQAPFFYADNRSTFFVYPFDKLITDTVRETDEDGVDTIWIEDIPTPEELARWINIDEVVGGILGGDGSPINPDDPGWTDPPEPGTDFHPDERFGGAVLEGDLAGENVLRAETMNRDGSTAVNLAAARAGSDQPQTARRVLAYSVSAEENVASLAGETRTVVNLDDQLAFDRQQLDLKTKIVKRFRFDTFYHPHVCAFIRQLRRYGIDGLLRPPEGEQDEENLRLQRAEGSLDFKNDYDPTDVVDTPYPEEIIDFDYDGAYAGYNWELFFHTPFALAVRLSENQRFEEAQQWFHYIFDPTETEGDVPDRFWRLRPFQDAITRRLQELMLLLNEGDRDMEEHVRQWRAHPFSPHRIARLRTTAYMRAVVMKYLDNLVAWGDQLFQRGTIESVNEATQLYVLAAQILGERPERIPERDAPATTFDAIRDDLDVFSNAQIEIETRLPAFSNGTYAVDEEPPVFGSSLLFCIPPNSKLHGYWDTVEDRLFKIRHCMDIEGRVRQLPLFEPPIDPALLVRAAAAGVDIGAAVSDVKAALPHYRFQVVHQKALALCGDVKALGGALLAALEKRDAEALSLLRAGHEIQLLEAVRQIKELQIEEANETLGGLKQSREITVYRRDYYRDQKYTNPREQKHIAKLKSAHEKQQRAHEKELAASVAHLLPTFDVGIAGISSPLSKVGFGGPNVGQALQAWAKLHNLRASKDSHQATMASILGGYDRRADEWALQAELADRELKQMDRHILAAEIRLAVAEHELERHDQQREQAKEVEAFLENKFTNQALYNWMAGQLSGLYFQSYQLAYDLAKRAEQAYRFELGDPEASFVQFGHWDSRKKGLLAGERLHHDLRRMEVAHLDRNRRAYELTKHVSLAMLDPVALIRLKETGACEVRLPEALFDMDYPGHYMRRLKSVSLTIPCVTGPYTNVNCTLMLLRSAVRATPTVPGGDPASYDRTGSEDERFRDYAGAVRSIATSSAQRDSGLFELNFRDERYLPFEGMGAVSTWRLELSGTHRFDADTITDAILHLQYTARDGGAPLKSAAEAALQEKLEASTGDGPLVQFFSAKQVFSAEWHRFLHPEQEGAAHEMQLALTRDRFPYHPADQQLSLTSVQLFVALEAGVAYDDAEPLTYDLEKDGTSEVAAEANQQFQQALDAEGQPIEGLLAATAFADDSKELGVRQLRITTPVPEALRSEGSDRLDLQAVEDLLIVCVYARLPSA